MSNQRNAVPSALDVAVIGMAGKFPQSKNIDEFWNNLKNGKELISFFSIEELEKAGVSPELLNNPNYVRAWGILDDIEYFDADFFGYTPFEAEAMDPQIRLAHECIFEALEDAGYISNGGSESIGLYFTASSNPIWEWANQARYNLDSSELSQLFISSLLASKDFLATRISFKFDLKGPSYVMGTACSSSLVAIHIAARALLLGECDIAVAGGVSIGGISIPTLGKTGYLYQEGLIVSPDGHCRAFDSESKGTVGGNGVGAVVLRRLSDAIKERDNIYAVIKGSAINNDGKRKVAYSAPSVDGQAEVIRMAQRIAKIPPESISYIEAHGTGTQLGDPVEIEGLKIAFNTKKNNYCAIGTVKSNIGHLNAAAGVAGFIKTVLSIKYKQIPPSLHLKKPNPKIDFLNSPFFINTKLKDWESENYPLRAGVSSFGVGGTNAHVILEEYLETNEEQSGRLWHILLLSAKTKTALTKSISNLCDFLRKNRGVNLGDVAYTLMVGRQHFNHRRFVLCSCIEDAIESLSLPNTDNTKHLSSKSESKVAFLFPDQGSQYINMALELYHTEFWFKKEMDRCFEIINSITNVNLKKILFPGENNKEKACTQIKQPYIAQPLTFIVEYSLARLMIDWGVRVYAMMGCGVGEYVAACLAGVFKLEDALKIVLCRGKLIEKLLINKLMHVSEETSPTYFKSSESVLIIKGAFDSTIKSKDTDELILINNNKSGGDEASCTTKLIGAPFLESLLKEFKNQIRSAEMAKPDISFVSSVTGDWITIDNARDPHYWINHIFSGAKIKEGVDKVSKKDSVVLIKVGSSNLENFAFKHEDTANEVLSLIRNSDEEMSDVHMILRTIGQLWLSGVKIDWKKFYAEEKRRRITLPSYPFEHKRYWNLMQFYEGLNYSRK